MTLISAMPSVLMKHLCWRLWFYSSDHKFFLPPHWALSKDDGSYLSVLCERWTGPPGGCWEALRWGWFFWGSVPDLSQWAPWWRSWLQINATRAIGARLDGRFCQSCVQHSFGFHLLMLTSISSLPIVFSKPSSCHIKSFPFIHRWRMKWLHKSRSPEHNTNRKRKIFFYFFCWHNGKRYIFRRCTPICLLRLYCHQFSFLTVH